MQDVIHGDCHQIMKEMSPNSIDAIVTDPPYGLKFMGKKWDAKVPGVNCWEQTLSILKPGGYALIFGGSRTYHRMAVNVEDAGYHIVDCIMWLHGQGFPKSKSQLKPAYEPIILARKKADKVLPLQIDDCRIPTNNKLSGSGQRKGLFEGGFKNSPPKFSDKGRYPANVILDEVAAELVDKQSGESISVSGGTGGNTGMWAGKKNGPRGGFDDSGGASRFFYCAKASPSERNQGLEGMPLKNYHPTVKPLKLMEYLIKLVMPTDPSATLLDPYCGSGTTLLAAKRLGRNAIGIELEPEYCDIAKARLDNYKAPAEQFELFKEVTA